MEWLNISGSIASLLGLLVAIYTLYKVTTLPVALKRHSRENLLNELIEKILNVPESRSAMPRSNIREVEQIIEIAHLYYVSKFPFKHRPLKSLLDTLESEIQGRKQRAVIQSQIRLIRDEITIR